MAIELASKFAPYVDEQFKQESKTSVIATAPFDFAGANVVNVYTVSMRNFYRHVLQKFVIKYNDS